MDLVFTRRVFGIVASQRAVFILFLFPFLFLFLYERKVSSEIGI